MFLFYLVLSVFMSKHIFINWDTLLTWNRCSCLSCEAKLLAKSSWGFFCSGKYQEGYLFIGKTWFYKCHTIISWFCKLPLQVHHGFYQNLAKSVNESLQRIDQELGSVTYAYLEKKDRPPARKILSDVSRDRDLFQCGPTRFLKKFRGYPMFPELGGRGWA